MPPPPCSRAPGAVETKERPGRRGGDGALLRSRHLRPAGVDRVAGRPGVVRPRAAVELRLQPRGGRALLRARGRRTTPASRSRTGASRTRRARTTTRTGTRSTPVDLRASLRLAHDAVTRARELADDAAPVERDLIEALAERFPAAEPPDDFARLEDRLRGRDGGRPRAPPRRPRRRRAVRRRDDEPHAVAAVGGRERRAGRGRPHARDQRVLERGDGAAGRVDAPGLAASLRPPDGDVGAPRAGARAADDAARRSSPAPATCSTCRRTSTCCAATTRAWSRATPPRSRRTTPYAEHAGDVGFYQLYRAHDHHFRIYGAMFAAQQQVALEASPRARGDADRGAAAHRGPADGGLARGVRADAAARARALRPAGTS